MHQSCIKYSTNKYQYQYQWSKYQYKYQYLTFKHQYQYQYITFKYQYQYKYCAYSAGLMPTEARGNYLPEAPYLRETKCQRPI